MRDLDRFQRRALAVNEIKAKAHRRFVVGFREMHNYLQINKVKLAIIAPDCEQSPGEGKDIVVFLCFLYNSYQIFEQNSFFTKQIVF